MHPTPLEPPRDLEITRGWSAEYWWGYEQHASTWRLQRAGETRFLKLRAHGWTPTMDDERVRIEWARRRLPVPEVIAHGTEGQVDWMLLRALPGLDATRPEMKQSPAATVPLLARALRRFHETPPDGCPFDFRLDAALELIESRVRSGRIDPARDFHPEHAHHTPESALAELRARRPADEDVVLCHGDYCAPNVVFADGELTGFLDLGELGVADRWWDVAVGGWSVCWNYGQQWEQLFYDSYGVARDDERVAYYRLMYDCAS